MFNQKEKMFRMDFTKEDFNALLDFLNKWEIDRFDKKILSYATVIEDEEGMPMISLRFFGDELAYLCRCFMFNLPEEAQKDHFTSYVETIKKRQEEYQAEKEAEYQRLYDGIRNALLENPKATGGEIARKLKVGPSKVYSIWNQVREDIGKGKV